MDDQYKSKTISVPEAAALVGIAPNSYYRAVRAGEVPGRRVGGRVLVPREELLRFLGESDRDTHKVAS